MNRKPFSTVAFFVIVLITLLLGAKTTMAQKPPSAVENAINAPEVTPGQPGTSFRYVKTLGTTEPYIVDGAHLFYPNGLFIDSEDKLYTVEERGNRMLMFTSTVTASLTIGHPGYSSLDDDYLANPKDITVSANDHIWIAMNPAIKEFDENGQFVKIFPESDPWMSGTDNDRFNDPRGLAFDSAGRLFVSDSLNHRVQVYEIVSDTLTYSTTIGITGVPTDTVAGFNEPGHLGFDSSGRLYVVDTNNYRVQRCSYATAWDCVTFFGTGSSGNDLTHLGTSIGMSVWDDEIYIADMSNYRVLKCDTAGTCIHFAGTNGEPGSDIAHFDWPSDVAVDSAGNVYVSDEKNCRIQKFDSAGTYVSTIGVTGVPYITDVNHYNAPVGLAATPDDSLYILEGRGHRLLKLDSAGALQWAVGEAGVEGGDNQHLSWASDVAVDAAGRVYVSEVVNQRVQIFNSSGVYSATVGTTGVAGSGNDQFHDPQGLTIAPNGDLYVADGLNHRVQIFDSQLNYLATIGETGVPGSDNSHLNNPKDVAVDSNGTIYISDDGNFRIQVLNSYHTYLRTIGTPGSAGDDFDHFNVNFHLAVDAADNLYVVDSWNNRVQVFDPTGAYLTTIAGSWGMLDGQIYGAEGIAVDSAGNVFVGDHSYRIQKFAPGYPGWQQANINGFGSRNNIQPMRLSVHNDYLYASTSNYANSTEMWRTDANHDWEKVSSNGFGVISNTESFVESSYNGYLYVGTRNEAEGAELWRCAVCDGTDWNKIADGGFDDPNNTVLQRVLVFSDTLFAEVDNYTTGLEVWKSTTGDAGSWTQTNEDGFGNPLNKGGWAADVYNGYLYVATCQWDETSWAPGGFLGTEVWRTNDGVAWNEVTPTDITGNSNAGWDLATMKDQLYFSTGNEAGTEIRRCTICDGSDWELLTGADFGIRAFGAVFFGYRDNLYVVNSNNWMLDQLGLEVWESPDGTSWTKIVSDGFGKRDNTNIGAGMIVEFYGNLYVGIGNYTNGSEVWQMLLYTNYLPLISK